MSRTAEAAAGWWKNGTWRFTPRAARRLQWSAIAAVTLLAAAVRLWNLGHPGVLVFDEIYYVRDSYSQLLNGFPTKWAEGLGMNFGPNEITQSLPTASYVVHPPLGKWLIGLGMLVCDADNGWGWRMSTAVAGTLAVLLVTVLGRRLFRSTLIGVIAGFLMAIDGLAIVMSRVSLLDNFLMLAALLGAYFVLLDRDQNDRVWQRWLRATPHRGDYGPVLWRRPWLLAASITFGLAAGIKWSGLYVLAGFGLYLVIRDMYQRRKAGLVGWFSAGVLTQGLVSFALLVPLALASYLATWTGWLLTSTGWNRGWAAEAGNAATGFFSWVPHWAQSLWHYHTTMYQWHSTLNAPHPYMAHPLTWPLALRPTSMYYESFEYGQDGCTISKCSEAITSLPNPLIWWGGLLALGFLAYLLVRYRDGVAGFILVGALSGYLPWLLTPSRSAVFQFYTIAYAPFVYLALAYAVGWILGYWRLDQGYGKFFGTISRRHPLPRITTPNLTVVAIFLVTALAVSIYFYPLWTGTRISFTFWQLHIWLPGWS
ncbi:phospholipid carrier-dependent glycosyltransferase [Klugiella xanthotipulae]|uniref:Polyprenol-phosphate-mannose--protein mannosyltransferase n=1 Tax=Klugiella xanthotipulae TaxID=244735 RepID=A0A543HY59_9MICO|nr:dolichyl-phosphate-mannose-protein mannosyltransferase [Klugiella xanthotipulae]